MADCSFSTNLSNGAKAGILGLLIGGMIAAFKGLGVKLPPRKRDSGGGGSGRGSGGGRGTRSRSPSPTTPTAT